MNDTQSFFREELSESFHHIIQTFNNLLLGVSNENQNWSSAESSWSVVECILHLNLTSQIQIPFLRQAVIDAKKADSRQKPFKPGFFCKENGEFYETSLQV